MAPVERLPPARRRIEFRNVFRVVARPLIRRGYKGSIRDVTDNSGVVKDSIGYDGFGNIISETNSTFRGRYAWTGREFETETGLQYNRARWYDPATGRWLSQDPLGFDAGDSNLYRYANNRPTSKRGDPSGLDGLQEGGWGYDDPINWQVAPSPTGWANCGYGLLLLRDKGADLDQKLTNIVLRNRANAPLFTLNVVPDNGVKAGADGNFQWVTGWQLNQNTLIGGYVIQEITFNWNMFDVTGQELDTYTQPDKTVLKTPVHYWEAWKIEPGSKVPIAQDGGDNWYWPANPNTMGDVTVTGKAAFYEGYVLGADWKRFNTQTFANSLLATANPPFPGLSKPSSYYVNRNVVAWWDSTGGAPSPTQILFGTW